MVSLFILYHERHHLGTESNLDDRSQLKKLKSSSNKYIHEISYKYMFQNVNYISSLSKHQNLYLVCHESSITESTLHFSTIFSMYTSR